MSNTWQMPSEEILCRGPVAIIECPEEIPCNPCQMVCPSQAITMDDINDTPVVDYDKCKGCGLCVQVCPGLAIFMVSYANDKAVVSLP